MQGRDKKCIQILIRKLGEDDIILRCVLRKLDVGAWFGFIWLKIKSSGRFW
jgi:hypothetical protein